MAPEQLEGKEADSRTDIFALCMTLYEMLTAQRAFHGDTQANVMAAILEREPRLVSAIIPMSPPSLDHLTKKCLAKDPEQRWQTARDLKDQLKWIMGSEIVAATQHATATIKQRSNVLAWSIAAIAMIATVIVTILHVSPRPLDGNSIGFTIQPNIVFGGLGVGNQLVTRWTIPGVCGGWRRWTKGDLVARAGYG